MRATAREELVSALSSPASDGRWGCLVAQRQISLPGGRNALLSIAWCGLRQGPHEQVVEGLRPLLELPVEHVLATRGGPTDRAALERALSSS